MNMLGLARRAITRKPVKRVIIMVVVVIISTLLLAVMATSQAGIKVQDQARQAVGAGFLLEKNDTYRSKRVDELSNKIGMGIEGSLEGYHQKKMMVNGMEMWHSWTTNEFETLDRTDIEKLAKVNGISAYNITTAITAVHPVNFQRIEDKDVDQQADVGGVSLIGNKDMTLDRNVLSGNVHIKEGRMITSKDQNVCVISEELAMQNKLRLGDRLTFNNYQNPQTSKKVQAVIVGIYQVDKKMSPLMQGDTYRSENVIFTDLDFPQKAEGETCPLYERAYFKVGNVNNYGTVNDALKNVDIDWQQYDLIDNNGNSETMASNFNELAKVSRMMFLLIAATSMGILALVFLFWIKGRVREMGIYLSMGQSKWHVFSQIWTEAMLITVCAVTLSFTIAPGASNIMSEALVAQQVTNIQENETSNKDAVETDYVAPKQDVQNINVEITPTMYLLDGGCVVILVSGALLLSSVGILRRNPKEILSELS